MKRFTILSALLFCAVGTDAQNPTATTGPRPEAHEAGRIEDAVRTLFGVLKPARGADTSFARANALYTSGMELERAGKVREALANYDQAMRANPEDPRPHLALGRLLESSNPALSLYHYQSAFRYAISAAAEDAPAIELIRRFLVGRYLQYALPIDDAGVSAKLLELAVSLAPEDPRIHAHLAMAYFYQGNYDRSIQESRNALALGLDDGLIQTNIAAAYAQLGRKDETESALLAALNRDELDINEALNAIRRSNESDTRVTFSQLLGARRLEEIMKNSTKGRLEAALEAWNSGDSIAAIRLASLAAEGNPRHSYSLIVVGDFKRAVGDTVGAKAAYREALRRNARNQLAYPRLGDLAYAEAKYGEAADHYAKAMDLMSGRIERIDLLDRTAVALAQQKKHDQALALLDQWLRANPNAPEAFELSVRRAGILTDAGRTPQAEQLLRGLIDRDKLNPAGYVALHSFYTERNQERKARELVNDGIVRLQAARDKDPLNPDYYRDLARLYHLVGNRGEAKKALRDGGLRTNQKRFFANALFVADAETEAHDVLKSWLAAEPRNPEAILSYGWVSAKLSRDLDKALVLVNQVARENAGADMTPIRRTRAYLYHSMGECQKAIDEMKLFLKADVPEADFFYRIWGLSAEELGRRSEAITNYKKAMELDPDAHADLAARVDALSGGDRPQGAR